MHSHAKPSRRKFLKSATLATGACLIRHRAAATESSELEILGQGDYRYRAVPEWGVLDGRTPVNDCHGMVEDKAGGFCC